MRKKNRLHLKGFTLIEIVVALAIVVMLGGFTLTSLSAISQNRMKQSAQTLKSEFELTRNFAKTHGGQATLTIEKVDEGLLITRSGKNIQTEENLIKDRNIALLFTISQEDPSAEEPKQHELGGSDEPSKIQMTFAQTTGEIIGPDFLDTIQLSNGSKEYTFIVQQTSGMLYYDYEIDNPEDYVNETEDDSSIVLVETPTFVENGAFYSYVDFTYTGETIQPEINYDSRYIKIGGVYRATDVRSYEIIFSLKDPYGTKWADDNSTEDKFLIWEIK